MNLMVFPPSHIRYINHHRQNSRGPGAIDPYTCICNHLHMNADKPVLGSPDPDYIDLAVAVFSMLAEPTRVRIILALQDRELSVGQIAEAVDKTPTAVSQHLAKLRLARMVASRQEGQRIFYSLTNEHARQLVADALFQAEHAVDEHPAHHGRA